MRKLLLILSLLFPTLLIAQQDSTKQTFKIGDCRLAFIYGNKVCLGDNCIIQIADFLKEPRLKVFGCGDSSKVISFTIVFSTSKGTIETRIIQGSKIPDSITALINIGTNSGQYIVMQDVDYKSKDDVSHPIKGIAFRITK